MPVTPFHFGPGALIKGAMPAPFSWSVFALANCMMDLEPIGLYLLTGDPAHPWLHTPPGALLVAIIAATLGRKPCVFFLHWWNRNLSPVQARWLATGVQITPLAAWSGAFLGTISHLLLDSIMHVDVRPLWPLSINNPLQGLVSIGALEFACVLCAAFALCALLWRRRTKVN